MKFTKEELKPKPENFRRDAAWKALAKIFGANEAAKLWAETKKPFSLYLMPRETYEKIEQHIEALRILAQGYLKEKRKRKRMSRLNKESDR